MNELLKAGFIKLGNSKAININDLPEDAWAYLVGGAETAPDLRKYYRKVAWLNRGVALRKWAVSSMPFTIYRGDAVIDTSDDFTNKLGFTKGLRWLFGVIEQSLTLAGPAYVFIEGNAMKPTSMRHLMVSSITPEFSKVNGELMYFNRDVRGKNMRLETDEVVWFWPPDDAVEIGPPTSWPALAALQAAGVLYAVDGFATAFFDRGAIKVTLLTTKGNVVEAERKRIKSWWDRIASKMWSAEVVNADQLEVVPVGEGLESLANNDLTNEKREDIATALGVPHSLLFSNASNFATSQQDKLNWYEDTIIPDCEFIRDVFNERVFEPMNYRLEFEPQRMALYQEDEEQRAQAYGTYIQAGMRPSIAGEMLGLALPEGIEFVALDEKYDMGLEMAEQLQEQPIQPREEREDDDEDEDEEDNVRIDLGKWERKALKLIKRGLDPACNFESDHIPPVMLGAIEGALESTTNNPDLVRALFADPFVGYP